MNEQIILIADDTPEDRVAYRRYLQKDAAKKYQFLEAQTGEQTIALCRERNPDCLLLDYWLPDMTGLEILVALANEQGEVPFPVVMLTGADEVEVAVAAMKAGAQDFINKNRLTPLDLQRAVSNAIERVALRRAVKESDQRFRTLAETIPQLVWTCAPDGRCDYLSSRWMEYSGTTLEENLGYGWLNVLHPNDVERTQEVWAQAVATASNYEVEFRVRRADGVYRWHLSRALPITNEAGRVVKWFGSCTDIEERKQAEREREESLRREQQLRTQAEQANRLKDEFLATISHELRTPLNHMYGWVRLLRSGGLAPNEIERALETVERNVQAQNKLIEDLLDVSRIITGKMRLDIRPIALAEVVEATIEAARPAAEAKGVWLQVIIDPRSNMINGDPNRLQQIVWNLVSNAIKFTPKDGYVQVRVERANSHVRLTVSDTGEGIAPEFLPYVFERFRQQDGSKTRKHGGLGLGLAIVRHLTELHGGCVSVESRGGGQGATFIVELPLVITHSVRFEPEERGAGEFSVNVELSHVPRLDGVRVLAVDDEPDSLALLEILLNPAGAEVRTAGGMAEALELLKKWQPDILVSDIGMPNGNGYELLERVRELERSAAHWVPAVALTAYASAEDRMKALAAGYQLHVVKPVEPAELITVIASLTGRLSTGMNV